MPGIIADRRPVLVSEDGYDGAVEIENQPGARRGLMKKMIQKSVVDAMQVLPESGGAAWSKKRRKVCGSGKLGKPIRCWKVPLEGSNEAVSMRSSPNTGDRARPGSFGKDGSGYSVEDRGDGGPGNCGVAALV
jgi:hypothetical protein